MKELARGKFWLCTVSLLLVGLLGTGCGKSAPVQTTPTPKAAGTFTGQDLPSVVEELDGTPLYSVSEEISAMHDFDGAAYLLIAPQDPTKALLVSEAGVSAAKLAERESKPSKVSGSKVTIDSEKLKSHVSERYQLTLQSDASGKIILLKARPAAAKSTDESEIPSEQ